MGQAVLELRFQSLMFCRQFTEMRLNAHQSLLCVGPNECDTDLGTCRTLCKGIGGVWKTVRKRGQERRMIDGTEENLLQTRLMTLRQQHRDLDAAISSLEATGTGDQLQLRRLKKMKLQIKDEIQKVEDKLIPDIIA